MIMTDDQINNEFVDIVMEQLYDVELESQKTFEEAVKLSLLVEDSVKQN